MQLGEEIDSQLYLELEVKTSILSYAGKEPGTHQRVETVGTMCLLPSSDICATFSVFKSSTSQPFFGEYSSPKSSNMNKRLAFHPEVLTHLLST